MPEDECDFEVYNKAYKMHSAILDFANWIRSEHKHANKQSVKFESLREKFYEILNENEVGDLF